ncbi:MAG: sulfurtransferase [Burkholderiales bacterium]|nr:sulfurtransferase [Burkholderiales bacterium]OJX07836.1 MAG: sulfurtransferase [Burkholderiales bacterium 70-64]
MPRILLLCLTLLGAVSAFAQAQPLLAPEQLKALLGNADVRIVDIREGKTPEGQPVYTAGHVPGAVSAPYSQWRGPKDNPGALPPLDKLTATIRSLGLAPQVHAVIVSAGTDSTDFGAAARVYWTLKVAGLKQLSILNGGYKAWTAASLPTRSDAVKVAASSYTPVLDRSLIATRDEIAALDPAKVRLLDARPKAFFEGDTRAPAAKVPGTLVGAENFDNARWFRPGTATFVPTDEAKRLAEQARLDGDVETVSFCNTGHWAATNWFALSEVLGEKDVKLYPESMVDWSRSGLPMANVPNRAKQLLIDAKLWWQRTFN